jgi:hypothetical protein
MGNERAHGVEEQGLQQIAGAAWRVLKQANEQRKAAAAAAQSGKSGQ